MENTYIEKRRELKFEGADSFSLNARGFKKINNTLSLELKNKKKKKPVSLSTLKEKAQREFNRFIRNRDKDKGCISSGGKVLQAGHFYNAGQYSALRFNEDNVHGQSLQDNYFKHGNLSNYRQNLIKRIGQKRLDLLDAAATRQKVKRWTRTELETIYQYYKKLNNDQTNN